MRCTVLEKSFNSEGRIRQREGFVSARKGLNYLYPAAAEGLR